MLISLRGKHLRRRCSLRHLCCILILSRSDAIIVLRYRTRRFPTREQSTTPRPWLDGYDALLCLAESPTSIPSWTGLIRWACGPARHGDARGGKSASRPKSPPFFSTLEGSSSSREEGGGDVAPSPARTGFAPFQAATESAALARSRPRNPSGVAQGGFPRSHSASPSQCRKRWDWIVIAEGMSGTQ